MADFFLRVTRVRIVIVVLIVLGALFIDGYSLFYRYVVVHQPFPQKLTSIPTIAGHPVINRGVSGHETQDILARFDHDVIAARPRAVILWGYMNNIVNLPHGQGDQGEARAPPGRPAVRVRPDET